MRIDLTRRALSRGVAALSVALAGSGRVRATERPLLTISGKVKLPEHETALTLDRAMLEALGTKSFTTKTPWYEAPVTFEGVPMATLMSSVGASGETVVATALNDYVTEIPVSDFAIYGVLLALKRNGEYMAPRDKGPLFIVYPFDSAPELQHQRFYSRSAWQLARIVVK